MFICLSVLKYLPNDRVLLNMVASHRSWKVRVPPVDPSPPRNLIFLLFKNWIVEFNYCLLEASRGVAASSIIFCEYVVVCLFVHLDTLTT